MQTLKLTEQKARELYNTAPPEFKEVLIDSFGKDFFSQKITDRVKTFQDACKVLNIPDDFAITITGSLALNKDLASMAAYAKLIIIARALNEGWVPDWGNSSQIKYIPWFEKAKSGSGLSCSDYGDWLSCTTVGSRLCYKSSELATYAGKQFESIYNDFLNL